MRSGAGVPEGLRLLSHYAPSPRLAHLVAAAPERFSRLLVKTLMKFASPQDNTPEYADVRGISGTPGGKFREEWPFLSDPGCPAELKILAADKISAYHNYQEQHEKLYSCACLDDCFETAKNLLKNFEENRQITAEFAHYKEHHRILGKHPVFRRNDKLRRYREMSAIALTKEEKRLLASIWRDESEIRKGDKPHLTDSRTARLEQKHSELAYVKELIAEYENSARSRK